MSAYFVTISPDDRVTKTEYNGLKSIQEAVGGYIECITTRMFKVNNCYYSVVFYCDEEYRLKNMDKYCKVNAVASLLSGTQVYGNVVVMPVEGDDDTNGYDEEQCNAVMGYLSNLINAAKVMVGEYHKHYDCIL